MVYRRDTTESLGFWLRAVVLSARRPLCFNVDILIPESNMESILFDTNNYEAKENGSARAAKGGGEDFSDRGEIH